MKIYLPQRATEGDVGGGFTFVRNIKKALKDSVEFIDNWQNCDIYFIPGPTLAERNEVQLVKEHGKKIVLRIDNIPRNSRNRNTGTSRLYDFAQMADEVIYQSQWARDFIKPFIKKDGEVILNGTDTDIFKPEGDILPKEGEPQYLYSRHNRDETKRWEDAWYDFQRMCLNNPKAHLWIVGRFSPEQEEYHFDFFGGAEKRYRYMGIIESPEEMAKIYRSVDYIMVPYALDACSNVLIEARMCGTEVVWNYSGKSSSASEIMWCDKKELTLEAMGNKYLKVFEKYATP